MAVNYWIAQYTGDLFRREPRNVGVFVEADGEVLARFLGADENGQVDGRKVRTTVEFPDVYKQWIEFWNAEVKRAAIPNPSEMSGAHYHVIEGGTVDDVESGELKLAADHLYSLLVSTPSLVEQTTEDAVATELISELVDAFRAESILASSQTLQVPHPIKKHPIVTGKLNVEYRPSFTQENGRLYLMEAIDFTGPKKKLYLNHAGYTAYSFSDVKQAHSEAVPIAIVKFRDFEAEEDLSVRTGLEMLRNEAAQIVNWAEASERASFLDERREIARSLS